MPKLSVEKIRTRIAELQKQLTRAESQRQPAIRKVLALMKQLGVTITDLKSAGSTVPRAKVGKRPRRTVSGAVPVKYTDGEGNTWTGRGKTPRWLVEAEKVGKNRQQFLI